MKRIFKYTLPMEALPGKVGWNPEVALELPYGARILTAQAQHNEPVLWAEVDPEAKRNEIRRFFILNTGAEVPGRTLLYINTVQINDGKFIFHIYEDRS